MSKTVKGGKQKRTKTLLVSESNQKERSNMPSKRYNAAKPLELCEISPISRLIASNKKGSQYATNKVSHQHPSLEIESKSDFPFKASPIDFQRFTKSGQKKKQNEHMNADGRGDDYVGFTAVIDAVDPPKMFSNEKNGNVRIERCNEAVFENPYDSATKDVRLQRRGYDDDDDVEDGVIVLTVKKRRKERENRVIVRAGVDLRERIGLESESAERVVGGAKKIEEDDCVVVYEKKKNKRKFEDVDRDGNGHDLCEKIVNVANKDVPFKAVRQTPTTTVPKVPKTTTTTTLKKRENTNDDDDDTTTTTTTTTTTFTKDNNNNNNSKRRRRCSSNADFERKIEQALDEAAKNNGTSVSKILSSKSGVKNSPPPPTSTNNNVFNNNNDNDNNDDTVLPPPMTSDGIKFEQGRTAKPQAIVTTKKSYKNFGKRPPPFAAKKTIAPAVRVGFGSSSRKENGIDRSTTASVAITTTLKSKSPKVVLNPFKAALGAQMSSTPPMNDNNEHQSIELTEFQMMIQRARDNLESSKSPNVVHVSDHRPSSIKENEQPILRFAKTTTNTNTSGLKHTRFASSPSPPPPNNNNHNKQPQAIEQQRSNRKPFAPSMKVNKPAQREAIDIVAKAKTKRYEPSTAEKQRKLAREAYEKRLRDAAKAEKLGTSNALDKILSSKATFTGVVYSPGGAGQKMSRKTYGGGVNGILTKAQKAHMESMEWDPL
jgi:hypothetical protein